jgi:hypothetical protein
MYQKETRKSNLFRNQSHILEDRGGQAIVIKYFLSIILECVPLTTVYLLYSKTPAVKNTKSIPP